MELEAKRRLRRATRSYFTRLSNQAGLQQDTEELQVSLKVLSDTYDKLELLNKEIQQSLPIETEDAEFEKEIEDAMAYTTKWLTVQQKLKLITKEKKLTHTDKQDRKYKLPVLETKKFDGNVKNWIPFWCQFEKIHQDQNLDDADKFQYLIQAMTPGTEVRNFIESYPSSSRAYQQALTDLKQRYAREDLLVQVYVRELLNMIIHKENTNLTCLYDTLSSHLRALETLGVTQHGFSSFLLPMIESTLPIETLRAWERARPIDSKDELNSLLQFLKREVESEQRIKMASRFTTEEIKENEKEITAATLVGKVTNLEKKTTCLWCDKEHPSIECYKLSKLSIDQRKEHIKKKNACMFCLKTGHFAKTCKAFVQCFNCKKKHSAVLCPGHNSKFSKETPASQTTNNLTSQGSEVVLLQTAMVKLVHEDKEVWARMLIDNGSQRSYLRKDVAQKLGLNSTDKEVLTHSLFSGVEVKAKEHNVYHFAVVSCDQRFKFNMIALDQATICNNLPRYDKFDTSMNNLLAKHNISLTDADKTNDTDISLLIGADYSGYIMTNTMIMLKEGLFAIKTKLGWVLQGKVNKTKSNITNTLFCTSDVADFWSLELLGIRDPVENKTKAQAEADAVMVFEETVALNSEGRYEVALPLKVGHEDLQSNRGLAEKRLVSTTKRLIQSGKFSEYSRIISNWESEGIVEKVTESDRYQNSHYLPHRGVVKDTSLTTKLRPVFDASACDKNGRSLNSYLNKGANLLDKIPHLLTGFRRRAIGISADIAKAFLQVSVKPIDRDYLRFLWWKDESQSEMVEYRHCRVVFGLTSSPFLLSATINHHLTQASGKNKDTADLLGKSFYVDNCLTSLDTEHETSKFILEAKEVMQQGKFDLRQWATSPMIINETGSKVISVLGLLWDTDSDELSCNLGNLPPFSALGQITKRELMSLIQRIFDPVGFTCPTTLTPRLIMQETWRRRLSWEENLPDDLQVEFCKWYKQIIYLKDCKIPRRLTNDIISECKVSLHLFCDASQSAIGCCVLLRSEKDGKVTIQMVSAKSRVAPPEKVTIPRLELTAALVGSRLLKEAKDSLEIEEIQEYCWIDSCVAYYWITRNLPWNTYVYNRVKEIRQNCDPSNWFHIPGSLNWSDVASRGCNADQLLALRWWEGPAWLRLNPEEWPKSAINIDDTEACKELKKTKTSCNITTSKKEGIDILCYFSKYTKIVRMMAWILRFIHNMQFQDKKKGEITVEEYENAEKKIIKIIQRTERYIKEQEKGLNTYLDEEGIVKVKTKLLLADFPESTKSPILLPAKNIIVRRLVEQRHKELLHAGANQLTADIRTRFWIIGIRKLSKSVIAGCTTCTRFKAKPVQAPTAPLPSERITCTAPFQVSGADLAGPMTLRNGDKCWVVLYTCAVYRCVHLELTKSLSTDAFMLTLRRFIARRGRISQIICDNGTNLVGTKNRLAEIDWDEVQKRSMVERIKWKMNAPTAAWWGGFFERLIRIMKELLRRILGQSCVDYEELQTILCECEAVMNQRPLTYVQDDGNTHLEPLTPSCFIQSIPNNDVTDFDAADANSLNSRLKYLLKLRDDFKQRFKAEYLTALVQRGKDNNNKQSKLNIGDIVLIQTEEKRVKWPLGIITDIYVGKDGMNRTASVKTALGHKIRPFQRLYPLEVSSSEVKNQLKKPTQSQDTQGQCIDNIRPTMNKCETEDVENQERYEDKENFQKEQQEEDDILVSKMSSDRTTRCGRAVRMPSKYDL